MYSSLLYYFHFAILKLALLMDENVLVIFDIMLKGSQQLLHKYIKSMNHKKYTRSFIQLVLYNEYSKKECNISAITNFEQR